MAVARPGGSTSGRGGAKGSVAATVSTKAPKRCHQPGKTAPSTVRTLIGAQPSTRPRLRERHLDAARVAPQAGAQHLERRLLAAPDEVGEEVARPVARRGHEPLLGRRQEVADEGVAARLDELQVAPEGGAGRADEAHGLVGAVGHRHVGLRRAAVHERRRRAVGRAVDLDRAQGPGRRVTAEVEREGPLGGPPAEAELAPPLREPHARDPGRLAGREPGIVRRRVGHALRQPGEAHRVRL